LYRFEYGTLVTFSAIFKMLPERWVYGFARLLGLFAYHVLKVRRGVVEENLRASFGAEKDETELSLIARGSYINTALTFVEMLLFPGLAGRIGDMVDMSEGGIIEDAFSRGKGVVFIGCHFGSWEMSGACVGALGYPLSVVAKTQSNRLVEAWINRYRSRFHMRVISTGAPVKHIVRAIRNGEIVGLISDQDAGSHGVFVVFFGRKASTPRGAAEFALRFGAPVLIGMALRTEPGKYHSIYREVEVRPDDTVESLTQRYTRVIEDVIRIHPDQYFWMHRRWKSAPPASPGPAGSGEPPEK
jgi:Kdo2-lipid IVA lauroyltransferase/acyltransferase